MSIITATKPKEKVKQEAEYATYNDCEHTCMDLSHLGKNGEWMHTLSLKLPNGRLATICVMQMGTETCLDTRFHGENLKTKTLGMSPGRSEVIKDLNVYAVICNDKKKEA